MYNFMGNTRAVRRSDSIVAVTEPSKAPNDAGLLVILPVIPWPLRRNGISLRYAPILEYLSQKRPVDILVLAIKNETIPVELPGFFRTLSVAQIGSDSESTFAKKIKTLLLGLWPWGPPYGGLPHVSRARLQETVTRHLAARRYSAVVWAAGFPDVVARIRRKSGRICLIADICDSPALAASRAQIKDPVVRFLRGYTTWKLRRFERDIHRASEASIYISSVDASASKPRDRTRIHIVPNGVSVPDVIQNRKARAGNDWTIGFLGDMSYRPNISAVLRLAGVILSKIRKELPACRLLIIGRNPVPEVLALQCQYVTVTGEVDDVWEYISRVTVFCFPLVEGAGLQNKILEAMYARIPVVASSLAARGVGGVHEQHLLIADSAVEIASQVVRLLRDPVLMAELTAQASELMQREFCWSSILARYETIVNDALAKCSEEAWRG